METKYKDSGIPWIGRIPENWKVARIKDLFKLFTGATPKSDNPDFWNGEIVWITPADYKSEDHYITQGRKNISKEGYESCATIIVPENSIIFSKRAPVGAVALSKIPLCTNQGCISCVPFKTTHSNFFYYLFSVATKEFELLGSGTTFLEISTFNYANFRIPVPPLAEQERIAGYLDEKCGDIDELIDVEQQMIADLEAYRQAIITEATTRGLNPDAPTKETALPWYEKIPSHWEIRRVKDFSVIYSGEALPSNYITDDNIFPVYGGGNILGYSKKKNNHNKLILGRVGGDGHVRFIKNEFWATDNALVIDTNLNKTYLCNVLNCADLMRLNTSTSQPLLTATKIKNVEIPVPPLSEQEEIAEYLDRKCGEIDELVTVKREKIATLKEYRKSLIYEAVTGKISCE